MATIHEALALARREKRAGFILDFGVDRFGSKIYVWAQSPDGGIYTWWKEDDRV